MDTFRLINLIKSEESILSQELDLSICLRTDGFFFSLIDKNYQLKAIGEFETDLSHGMTQIMTNLRNSFASIGIRLFNFSDIRVIVPSSKNVFVPFKLYDSTKSHAFSLLFSKTVLLESFDTSKQYSAIIWCCEKYFAFGISIFTAE